MRRMYNTMQYANENTTYCLVSFHNSHKNNESCNGSLVTNGVQEHGMNILVPFHNAVFDYPQEDEKKEAENPGE